MIGHFEVLEVAAIDGEGLQRPFFLQGIDWLGLYNLFHETIVKLVLVDRAEVDVLRVQKFGLRLDEHEGLGWYLQREVLFIRGLFVDIRPDYLELAEVSAAFARSTKALFWIMMAEVQLFQSVLYFWLLNLFQRLLINSLGYF